VVPTLVPPDLATPIVQRALFLAEVTTGISVRPLRARRAQFFDNGATGILFHTEASDRAFPLDVETAGVLANAGSIGANLFRDGTTVRGRDADAVAHFFVRTTVANERDTYGAARLLIRATLILGRTRIAALPLAALALLLAFLLVVFFLSAPTWTGTIAPNPRAANKPKPWRRLMAWESWSKRVGSMEILRRKRAMHVREGCARSL